MHRRFRSVDLSNNIAMACNLDEYDDDVLILGSNGSSGSHSPCYTTQQQLPSTKAHCSNHPLSDNQNGVLRNAKWLNRDMDSLHNIHMKREITWLNEKEVLLEKIHVLRCEMEVLNENKKDLHEQNAQLEAKFLTLHAENIQLKQEKENANQSTAHPSVVSYLLSFIGHR